GLTEIVRDYFPLLHTHLNAVNVFGITDKPRSQDLYLSGDRSRNGSGLNFCATRFLRHTQQELAAAKINGSRPFAHATNSLLAEACDRTIFESQFAPGLDAGLHGRALANIIVHCSRTWECVRWEYSSVLDDLSHLASFSSSALTSFGSPPASANASVAIVRM